MNRLKYLVLLTAVLVLLSGCNIAMGEDNSKAVERRITNYIADTFEDQYGVDLRKNEAALKKVDIISKNIRNEFSDPNISKKEISIPDILKIDGEDINLSMTVTRSTYNSLCDDICYRKKISEVVTRDEFFKRGKKMCQKLKDVLKKYNLEYVESQDIEKHCSGNYEQVYTAYFNSNDKFKDEGFYSRIIYSSVLDNRFGKGKESLEIMLEQMPNDKEFDIVNTTLFKDVLISLAGEQNIDFKYIEKRANEALKKYRENKLSEFKFTQGELNGEIRIGERVSPSNSIVEKNILQLIIYKDEIHVK